MNDLLRRGLLVWGLGVAFQCAGGEAGAATLLGQEGRFVCPNCGGTIFQQIPFTVQAGVVEIPSSRFAGQIAFDIEANTILMDWQISSDYIVSPLVQTFEFPNLAAAGMAITAAVLDPSSTLPYNVAFTPDSVVVDLSGIPVVATDFALINVTVVPEPASMALLAGWPIALVLRRRRG